MKTILKISTLLLCLFFTVKASNNSNSSNMEPTNLLKSYATYNRWANEQMVNWLKTATDSQLNQEVESSFSSLRATTKHIFNAEFGWLTTLNSESWQSISDYENTDDFFNAFIENSKAFENKVSAIMKQEGFEELRYLGKDKRATSIADIILHVFNHSTFHRGQLITIGRQVGLKNPPRTDYIYFINLDEHE
jgi:uncharacterized damage-inducible protein DinB